MQIAMFHNLPSGGAKRAVYEWTRQLSERHKIDVYTLTSADHSYCDIRPFVNEYHIIDFYPRRIFSRPLGRLNQLQRWRDLNSLTNIGQLIAGKIKAGNYDVVFAHPSIYTFIPTCLQFIEVPAVYYLHEPFGPTFFRNIQRPYHKKNSIRDFLDRVDPMIKLYNQRLENLRYKSIHHTKQLLACSRFTKQQIKVAYGINANICRYGVNTRDFFPLPEVSKEDHILSVGELSPRKGFDFLIVSIANIDPRWRPELKLVCNTIEPQEKKYIELLAKENKVKLIILTNLNTTELMNEYNKARFCVYSPVLEPFGLVPLEAMSCGTPVVGVREGGVQESIIHRHNGLLTDRDPVEFSEAIMELLSDFQYTQYLGKQGRDYVLENWNWEFSTNILDSYLEKAIA